MSRLCPSRVIWLAASILVQAASLWGQPAPIQYALGEIVASGGNPIGDGKGVLLRQAFDPDCRLSRSSEGPVSGYLGGVVSLDLTIISCPAGAPLPTIQCQLEVGGIDQSVSFQDTDDVEVPLPELTGIFPLHLACTIDGRSAESFETLLYMTWREAKPPVVRAPVLVDPVRLEKVVRVEWYQRACTWGAGLDATATERAVVEKVMAGLFAYGQTHWRYGKGLPGGNCVFCTGGESPGSCTCLCHWTNLVDEGNRCQSADCFIFSQILQNMLAMMGVVVAQGSTSGDNHLGFSTQPGLRALDPAFAGNLPCDPRHLPCSYLFPIHSFVKLNDLMYDATFNGIYKDLSPDLIDKSVVKEIGNDRKLQESFACFQNYGYGGWPYYDQRPSSNACKIDDTKPAGLISESVESIAVSTRGDGRPEVIGVLLEVEIRRAGSYSLGGGLYADGQPVSVQSADMTQFASPVTIVSGEPGRYPARLLFSAEEIVRAGITGPLTLRAWLASERGLAETREMKVPPLAPAVLRTLGERPARFYRPLEVTTKRQRNSLPLKVPVQVREDGDVILQARLSCRDETIAIASTGKLLARGEHVLDLEFPDARLAGDGLDRPCLVTFALHWGYPPTPVDWLEVGVGPLLADD